MGGFMAIPKDARITLDPEQIPKRWYNLAADLPNPIKPPLNPVTQKPAKPEDFAPIFCKPIIEQEGSNLRRQLTRSFSYKSTRSLRSISLRVARPAVPYCLRTFFSPISSTRNS